MNSFVTSPIFLLFMYIGRIYTEWLVTVGQYFKMR